MSGRASGMNALSASAMVEQQMTSLEAVLDEEIAALEQARFDMLDTYSHRKSRALSALTRAFDGLSPSDDNRALMARARKLRERLDLDGRLLRLHLSAVEEVAEIVIAALEDGEWDGTYQQFSARPE